MKRKSMPYYKHASDMRKDPAVREGIRRHGRHFYASWCLLLELLSDNWSGEGLPAMTLDKREWTSEMLFSKWEPLRKQFGTMSELGLTSFQPRSKGVFTIGVPNLAKYKDEYGKRAIRESKNSRRISPLDIDKEEEEEREAQTKRIRERGARVLRADLVARGSH